MGSLDACLPPCPVGAAQQRSSCRACLCLGCRLCGIPSVFLVPTKGTTTTTPHARRWRHRHIRASLRSRSCTRSSAFSGAIGCRSTSIVSATNEPVTDAKVKVTIGDAEPIDAEPAENGVYTVSFPRSGSGLGRSRSSSTSPRPGGDDLLVGAAYAAEGGDARAASPRSRTVSALDRLAARRQSEIRSC